MRHHVTAVTQRGVFKLQIRAEIYFLFSSCCEQREEMSSYLYHVQFNVQLFVIKKDIFNDCLVSQFKNQRLNTNWYNH